MRKKWADSCCADGADVSTTWLQSAMCGFDGSQVMTSEPRNMVTAERKFQL